MNKRGRFPIWMSICFLAAIMAAMLLIGSCSSGENQNQASSDKIATTNTIATKSSSVSTEIDGWWQTLGQSGSVIHHFTGKSDYIYMRDLNDNKRFTFHSMLAVKSLDKFSGGTYAGINESGLVVSLSNGATYFQMNSDKDTLQSRNSDGSGYSGTSSLVKMRNIPSELLELAKNTEGN